MWLLVPSTPSPSAHASASAMTRREIVQSWSGCVRRAIALGEADAANRLARAFVQRLREIGLW